MKRFLIPLIVFSLLISLLVTSYALDLGGFVKKAIVGGAIALLVDRFSGQLNDFINKLMANEKLAPQEATKVVPIISVGKALYVGAAQVVGPKDKVAQVQAVAQLEGDFHGEIFRVKALVPVTERGKITNLQRVQGVGISAVIDVKP
ncbi:hypothetical protein H5T87_05340 [bacterium]|nr:hypothetical protein [bacterium]